MYISFNLLFRMLAHGKIGVLLTNKKTGNKTTDVSLVICHDMTYELLSSCSSLSLKLMLVDVELG